MASVKVGGLDCRLEYLNEGGANFIFRIRPTEDAGELPTRLRKKLLRLRKHITIEPEDLLAGHQEWQAIFQPENLIEHDLVTLQADAVAAINDLIREATRRSSRRVGDLWPGGTHGVLVTDMSAGQNELLIELKSKWLAQSPNASRSATRCRTCALRAKRAAEGAIITATDARGICPLDLASDDLCIRRLAAARLTDDPRAMEYLVGPEAQSLFRTLREHQQDWDPVGVLMASGDSTLRSLSKAMTIRDCTLFVLVRANDKIEARLGDLDMKELDKLAKWRATEQGLIDGEWYMGAADSICALSRVK
ncbi:Inositol-pentakisphosphate 2-kinase [Friedmanniomyces endolithicus]|uniref:Inositol-pentakisphosphate 2-kinase n=1 Tax=Friedmanniomyces endolithicus TaxID=329885 RepID=A0A4U0UZU5_9PEZI|nr:Inositol-pentakisphosphate 2-kinase [Friedmanniomyces endolithicus]KAK0294829.1 Inositol-pentakisphosphate 2-kinase [Friedmanniomyces endolithicus]KAK0320987.1 Inositol-pentakisphosphate 2-kinase [Friedmanniomyces endolithicus]TKA41810.1 hypothetical protein B0A54_08236 [Friedmanniomyces endolithicus]